jgi:hypothetical protein
MEDVMQRKRYQFSCLALLVFVGACGASRELVLAKTKAGLDAAREALVQYNAQHEDEIVTNATSHELGAKELADYRAKRANVTKVFVVAYGALAAASVDDNKSLVELIDTAKALVAALRDLGVLK